jgi:hypothetical protein
MPGVLPGHEYAPGRRANRRARIEIAESNAFFRHLIKMWGLNYRLAIGPKISVTEVIRHDEDNVGPGLGHHPGGRHSNNTPDQEPQSD